MILFTQSITFILTLLFVHRNIYEHLPTLSQHSHMQNSPIYQSAKQRKLCLNCLVLGIIYGVFAIS